MVTEKPSSNKRFNTDKLARRLKALEHENAELKKIVADLTLDGQRIGRETGRLIRKREGLQVRRKQHKKHYPGPGDRLARAVSTSCLVL